MRLHAQPSIDGKSQTMGSTPPIAMATPNLASPPSRPPPALQLLLAVGKIYVHGAFFFFFSLNFFIGNRGRGGPPAPSSHAAFPPPFWAGKSSFIPAGASPASVCIGCGHPTWQDGAQGADGHGGGVSSPCPRMRRTSHVHRGASGHRASPGTTPSPIKKCRPPAVSWWLPFLPLASLWVPC